MSAPAIGYSAAAILLAAGALAGCSSADTADGSGTATPERPSATAPAQPPASSDNPPPAANPPAADEAEGNRVSAGGRCDIGQDHTEGLVVDGAMNCDVLNEVWAGAVADPAFATHGNRNTITVGDWTCRAHQTRPVQTGFCENGSSHAKFKVIHM